MDNVTTFLEEANKILTSDPQTFLAYDARQAFQLMQHLGGAVALVDLDLKGNDGLALVRRLRESFPNLTVVAISSVLGVP